MNSQPTKPKVTGSPHAPPSTSLHGRWLLVVRMTWVAVTVLGVGLFIAALLVSFERLTTVCTDSPATCANRSQLTPSDVKVLSDLGLSLDFYAAYVLALPTVLAVVWCAVGAFIFWRKPDDRMALFGAFTLVTFGVGDPSVLDLLKTIHFVWWLLGAIVVYVGQVSFLAFLYLFPDGRFVPRWTRWLAIAWGALWMPATFFPDSLLNVFDVPSLTGAVLPLGTTVIFLGFVGSVVVAQVYRYVRVSGPVERQQTKWVVFSVTAAIVGVSGALLPFAVIPSFAQPGLLGEMAVNTVVYLCVVLIPLSIGMAILRYRLWDIDLIINRALVYGMLTISVVGLYVLVVGSLGALLHERGNILVSLLAAGLVAVLFQPLRERLQRSVNRLMYGERDEPYKVLSHLGQRLEATLAADAVLQTIVETVAQALKLPYVAIALKQDGEFVTAAEYGTPVDEPTVLPLVYHKETVGRLILSPRAPKEPFGPADRRLLDDIARHAEVAVHAVRLTADLQRSRERLVTAREEERRRLRRNLHDGLGPQLATLTLKLDAARNLLMHEPKTADALLAELKAQTQDAISDIRRLVYDLRPPALDELGLIAAIREQATSYTQNDLNVSVEAPEQLPPLPAAVEVAAYRIVQEALTNVSRHARARVCRIRLSLGDELELEITDDGVGLPEDLRAGVGLSSMRERAAELGGSCAVEPTGPEGGTRVLARLPLPISPGDRP